ncbi:jg4290 [Pararge aegeria aegeria]|uniref:Jg4290 protein n=1 Tax=Pararge aegeria aegeria TaxID=348720 RepID=A0A8S4RJ73_9NEOP|nr:jg4290 [Pararge aegeria aegeria]
MKKGMGGLCRGGYDYNWTDHESINFRASGCSNRRISGFLCLRGAGRTAAAWRSRSRAAGVGSPQGAGQACREGASPLTGLEAPLLQLDEARRLEQRVEEAHVRSAASARGTSAPAVTPRLATRSAGRSRGRPHNAPMAKRRAHHVAAVIRQ